MAYPVIALPGCPLPVDSSTPILVTPIDFRPRISPFLSGRQMASSRLSTLAASGAERDQTATTGWVPAFQRLAVRPHPTSCCIRRQLPCWGRDFLSGVRTFRDGTVGLFSRSCMNRHFPGIAHMAGRTRRYGITDYMFHSKALGVFYLAFTNYRGRLLVIFK